MPLPSNPLSLSSDFQLLGSEAREGRGMRACKRLATSCLGGRAQKSEPEGKAADGFGKKILLVGHGREFGRKEENIDSGSGERIWEEGII